MACTIDLRAFLDLDRDGFKITLDGPDMGGHAAQIGQHDTGMGFDAQRRHEAADGFEDGVDRHQRQHRREHLQQQHRVEDRHLEAELQARESIG